MNAKSRLYVRYEDKTIEMNAIFARESINPFSDEYQKLQETRRQNPDFKITTRKIKKNPNKQTYHGLTYDYMRFYITQHASKESREELLTELEHLIDISKCYAKSKRYPTIKNWFLKQFPEIVAFGMPDVPAKEQKEPVEEQKETAEITISEPAAVA